MSNLADLATPLVPTSRDGSDDDFFGPAPPTGAGNPNSEADERRREQAAARAERARARAAQRAIPPKTDTSFSRVGLDELRAYRSELAAEEDKVSYWRRLLQARLDILQAGDKDSPIDPAQLRKVLTDQRGQMGRTSLVTMGPADDVPPLPDLAALWATSASGPEHEAALGRAEAELSSYRKTLHERIDAATAELIGRYHKDPNACLIALPLPR